MMLGEPGKRHARKHWRVLHLLHQLSKAPQLLSSTQPIGQGILVLTLLGAACTEVEDDDLPQQLAHLLKGLWQHMPQDIRAEGLPEVQPVFHGEVATVLYDAPTDTRIDQCCHKAVMSVAHYMHKSLSSDPAGNCSGIAKHTSLCPRLMIL